MIKSMTAYAKAEKIQDQLAVSMEIRTVNSRYLDCMIRVPHGYQTMEDKIKEYVSRRISRGRLEIRVNVSDSSEESVAFQVNVQKAKAYRDALVVIKQTFDMNDTIALSQLASVQGVIAPAEVPMDMDKVWSVMESCLEEALLNLDVMRSQEGDYLKKDFLDRLGFVEQAIERIKADASDLLPMYQKRLTERVNALCDGVVKIDEARIAQEAALLADRSDISEEIVRASSHVAQFRAIMDSPEAAGRKLNFLLQEFNREFNTMGSKVGHAGVSHLIVDVKSELERLREQVQNVE